MWRDSPKIDEESEKIQKILLRIARYLAEEDLITWDEELSMEEQIRKGEV